MRGSILITVIVLLSVLFVLGSALMKFSLTDLQIALNYENNLKAYNYAVSGVEIALGVLQADHDFLGEFSHDIDKGKAEVALEHFPGQNQDEWLRIVSTGTKNGARETLFLQFKIVPSTPGEALSAASLGWIEKENGEMQTDTAAQNDSSVFVRSDLSNGEIFALKCSELYSFSARSIYFEGDPSLYIEGCKVELAAETIVFRGNVVLSGEDACLHLKGPGYDEVRVQFLGPVKDHHSVILVEPGTYQIPGQYSVTPSSNMDDLKSYQVFPKIPGTTHWGQGYGY